MSPTELQTRFIRDAVVVITGASRGLGLEFVKQIIDKTEATVVATARNPKSSTELQSLASKNPSRLQLTTLNASDERSIEVTLAVTRSANADPRCRLGACECRLHFSRLRLGIVQAYQLLTFKLLQEAVNEISQRHSGIDLLINNAGIDEGPDSILQL